MPKHEIETSPSTPVPKGYGFLRKGNPYLTSLCRRETTQAKRTLYVVKDGSAVLGLRAPKWILAKVFQAERETRAKRKDNVQSRDNSAKEKFLQALGEQFPHLPEAEADKVASRAMKKRSGRVGRTGTLNLDTKVRLAVAAHARHGHTDYDERMKRRENREKARKAVHGDILKVMSAWKGDNKQHKAKKRRKSEKEDATCAKRPRRTSSRQKKEEPEVISLLSSDESDREELPPIDWDNLSDWFESDDEDEDDDDSAEEADDTELDSVGSEEE